MASTATIRHMPDPFYSKLHRAIRFATKQHKGQDRDGTAPLPYVTHPIDVVVRLRYIGQVLDEEILCAGALHDVVEECGVDPEKIEKKFGRRVRTLVEELTRDELTPQEREKLTEVEVWEERTRRMLKEIREEMSADARVVKLADRLSNLSEALLTRTGIKRDRYVAQTTLILEAIPRETNAALWDAVQAVVHGVPTVLPGEIS